MTKDSNSKWNNYCRFRKASSFSHPQTLSQTEQKSKQEGGRLMGKNFTNLSLLGFKKSSLLPTLIRFPSPGREKPGPSIAATAGGGRNTGRTPPSRAAAAKRQIVEGSGGGVREGGVGVVDLHEIASVGFGGVRVVHLGQGPVRRLDLDRRRVPPHAEDVVEAGGHAGAFDGAGGVGEGLHGGTAGRRRGSDSRPGGSGAEGAAAGMRESGGGGGGGEG